MSASFKKGNAVLTTQIKKYFDVIVIWTHEYKSSRWEQQQQQSLFVLTFILALNKKGYKIECNY